MAGIRKKGDASYCTFRFQGRRYSFALGKLTEAQALARGVEVDETLDLLERGRLHVPVAALGTYDTSAHRLCEADTRDHPLACPRGIHLRPSPCSSLSRLVLYRFSWVAAVRFRLWHGGCQEWERFVCSGDNLPGRT